MDVLAVVVAYNPVLPLLKRNLDALTAQIPRILVYDNGSGNIEGIRELTGAYKGVKLFENHRNLGLSVNYNRAARIAEERKIPWLLIMDQDTVIPENMISDYAEYADMDDTAVICPLICDRNGHDPYKELRTAGREAYSFVDKCVGSASMHRVSTLLSLGGFDERLFVDWVDYEHCANVITHGYRILRVNRCVVDHWMGDSHERKVRFLWKTKYLRRFDPLRGYYALKNRIYTDRKYGRMNRFACAAVLLKSILWSFYWEETIRRICLLIRGYCDGWKMAFRETPGGAARG